MARGVSVSESSHEATSGIGKLRYELGPPPSVLGTSPGVIHLYLMNDKQDINSYDKVPMLEFTSYF